jgi:hypothetical protein
VALERVLTDAEVAAARRARVQETAAEYRWSRVLQPLLEFCRSPSRAPDFDVVPQRRIVAGGPPLRVPALSGPRGALARARGHFREGGFRLLVRRAGGAVARRLAVSRRRSGAAQPPPSG